MKTTVSEKGQVTIPKALRDRLGLRAGTTLDFQDEDGRLIAVKVLGDSITSAFGLLKSKRSSDEIVDELRGPANLP
jgi:AbrB family looped-hinge helix DNA binding protein